MADRSSTFASSPPARRAVIASRSDDQTNATTSTTSHTLPRSRCRSRLPRALVGGGERPTHLTRGRPGDGVGQPLALRRLQAADQPGDELEQAVEQQTRQPHGDLAEPRAAG
jgi:hypothetical protein